MIQNNEVAVEVGDGYPIVFLHGLLGGVENWQPMVSCLPPGVRAVCADFPFFTRDLAVTGIAEAVAYTERVLDARGIGHCVLCGNSFGGHVAVELARRRPDRIDGLVLSGSSGLFERGFTAIPGASPSREWIRQKVAEVFYDPCHVTEALVEAIVAIVGDRRKARQLLRLAKSAKQSSVAEHLGEITCPALLIWGRQDHVTPPEVAEAFHHRLPHSELAYLDRCGHTPMLEHPQRFAQLLGDWWQQRIRPAVPAANARGASPRLPCPR